jgi:hypothetical protein
VLSRSGLAYVVQAPGKFVERRQARRGVRTLTLGRQGPHVTKRLPVRKVAKYLGLETSERLYFVCRHSVRRAHNEEGPVGLDGYTARAETSN